MPDPKLISRLEPEIEDAEEETFLLYTQPIPSQNLGFIDRESRTVEVTVGDKEYTIHQSPSVLSSDRKGGTTGAVLWKVTPSFASWLVTPNNILFQNDVLNSQSAVLELGCGISPLNAFALSPRIATYTLSDQPYVQRFVEENISENQAPKPSKKKPGPPLGKINFTTLDWETDTVTRALTCSSNHASFDVVLACDCVFNYALIDPFVSACADVCRLRRDEQEGLEDSDIKETICVVAQQLRNDDVFLEWLKAFQAVFRVWRVPDESLPDGLKSSDGFTVHCGILR